MSFAQSAASTGIVDALIAAETMRTNILLISELHKASCCEEIYTSAGPPSIARESFGIRLYLRHINLGLEAARRDFQADLADNPCPSRNVADSTATTADAIACTEQLGNRYYG